MLKLDVKKPYICQYCNHGYSQERTLAVHMCEQKRRHMAKSEKHVMLGYQMYVRFYQLTQNSSAIKTYTEFAKSPYYNAFIKFGSFMSNTDPLYPAKFMEWIIKSGVKLDHWCRDELYVKYVVDLVHTESVETALERSVTHMNKWAAENNTEWNQYFRKVSASRAAFDLKDGKVSPWLVLNSPSGKQMLREFDDQQLAMVGDVINPQVWVKKFKQKTFDLELVKTIVKEGGL